MRKLVNVSGEELMETSPRGIMALLSTVVPVGLAGYRAAVIIDWLSSESTLQRQPSGVEMHVACDPSQLVRRLLA